MTPSPSPTSEQSNWYGEKQRTGGYVVVGCRLGGQGDVTKGDRQPRRVALSRQQEAIDTSTWGGKLIFHLFGALAEYERDVARERTGGRAGRLPDEQAAAYGRFTSAEAARARATAWRKPSHPS